MSDAYVSKTLRERVALQARYPCGLLSYLGIADWRFNGN